MHKEPRSLPLQFASTFVSYDLFFLFHSHHRKGLDLEGFHAGCISKLNSFRRNWMVPQTKVYNDLQWRRAQQALGNPIHPIVTQMKMSIDVLISVLAHQIVENHKDILPVNSMQLNIHLTLTSSQFSVKVLLTTPNAQSDNSILHILIVKKYFASL